MLKKYIYSLAIGFSFAIVSFYANATLIGDTVSFEFSSPLLGQSSTGSVLVQTGSADVMNFDFGFGFGPLVKVNIEETSILFNFLRAPVGTLQWVDVEKFIISDMQFLTPAGVISGLNFDTDISGFSSSRISFTPDSVTVDMSSLLTRGNEFITINLQSYSVPEPTSVALLGLGGIILLALRRKSASRISRSISTHGRLC
jgi:hypothetical protein